MADEDIPAIDPFDPMLEQFALQHDLRERFYHALLMIAAVKVDSRRYKEALELAQEIARSAFDEEALAQWHRDGRPLPWLDAELGDEALEVEAIVAAARASVAVV